MSKERQRRTQSSQKPRQTRRARWPQLAILGGVALLVAAILILKNRPADPPAVAGSEPQATVTLPEAVGQTEAAAELAQADSQPVATAPGVQGSAPGIQGSAPGIQGSAPGIQGSTLPDELPEAQLERLLAAGQPTLAFFHSNNCVQCIKMMEVVEQVYPEFDDSVALVDVNVRDSANTSLTQRAQIRAIPTQIFFDRTGQGTVILGVMTPDRFREQMQTLARGQ
jgi:thiol:disulfide interchange protein